jgi:serine/threonine protein kinase
MATAPDDWKMVKQLFEAALELDRAQRSFFLKGQFPDETVRAEVQRLLAEHEQAGSFLSTPVVKGLLASNRRTRRSDRFSGGRILGGRYDIVSLLGSGGMGVVYKANDSAGNRTVAIKLVRGSESMTRKGRMGLVREARIAGSLRHPNIVTIYDIGQYKGWLYLVMEYLSGATLDRIMRSNDSLSHAQKMMILVQLCDALDHAHRQGVIHRDVKPANTFIAGYDRIVKVLDFGLALQTDTADDGRWAGTFPYMSPEQFGGRIDCRTDVWSAGVTAYELLNGNRPFRGSTPAEIRRQIDTTPMPPIDSSIPLAEELSRVLTRALAKNQQERCTAAELAREFGLLARKLETGIDNVSAGDSILTDGKLPTNELNPPNPTLVKQYVSLDLGYRRPLTGSVTIHGGRFWIGQLQRLIYDKRTSIVHSSLALPGDNLGIFLLVICMPFLFGLLILQWAIAVLALVVRHPRCRGCGLTMALTTAWNRQVKSNVEVVLGYEDCIAALQESLWQDAAKLLCIHGSEQSGSYGNELISTPLRYHLDYYECGICSHHAARLTTDDLIEHRWVARVEFTEAYSGEPVTRRTLIKHLRWAPLHITHVLVGCVRYARRHAEPIQVNIRVLSTVLLFLLVVCGVAIQSARLRRIRRQQSEVFSRSIAEQSSRSDLVVHGAPGSSALTAEYYKIATGQGNSREKGLAANELGRIYEKGLGVPRDYGRAVLWYRLAAEHANLDGARNLARLYEKGIGVRKDLSLAEYWYAFAGDQAARDRVVRMKVR